MLLKLVAALFNYLPVDAKGCVRMRDVVVNWPTEGCEHSESKVGLCLKTVGRCDRQLLGLAVGL